MTAVIEADGVATRHALPIPAYRTVHAWLRLWRGAPDVCVDCGGPAKDWAFDNKEPFWPSPQGPYYPDPSRYVPLCQSCHEIRDSGPVCANGHRWADGNRYRRKDGKGTICRACRREGMARRRRPKEAIT